MGEASPSIAAPVSGKSLAGGVLWSAAGIIGEQGASLVAFALVARMLGPAEFGSVVLAFAVFEILLTFVRSGIPEAVVQAPELDRELLGSALWLNVAIGVFLAAAVWAAASPFAAQFVDPKIEGPLKVLALALPLMAISNVAEALLLRRMQFALVTRRQIGGSVLGGVVAVGAALAGAGAWALVAQRLTIMCVSAALTLTAARFAPPLTFSRAAATRAGQFAVGVLASNLLWRVRARGAEVLVGLTLSSTAVGLFRVAQRMLELLTQLPFQPIYRVTMPALSRLHADPARFRTVLLTFTAIVSAILIPAYAAAGVLAEHLFHFLFGPKWGGAVPAFQILLVAASLNVPFSLLEPAMSARGASRGVAAIVLLDATVALGLLAGLARYGAEWAAGAMVVAVLALMPVRLIFAMRLAQTTAGDLVRVLWAPCLTALAILTSVLAGRFVAAEFGVQLGMFGEGAIGGVALVAASLIWQRKLLEQLVAMSGVRLPSRLGSFLSRARA